LGQGHDGLGTLHQNDIQGPRPRVGGLVLNNEWGPKGLASPSNALAHGIPPLSHGQQVPLGQLLQVSALEALRKGHPAWLQVWSLPSVGVSWLDLADPPINKAQVHRHWVLIFVL